MQKFLIAVILILIIGHTPTVAQDEVLFMIDGIPVFLDEFKRVYGKNKGVPGYEDIPAEEYLDMYINFRLKVLEAERLGYDEQRSFTDELAGYREQLAVPYLQDQDAIDRLVREAYERTVNEVNVSHIYLAFPEHPSPDDTLRIYKKITDARGRIMNGEAFEKVALETSEDPSVRINQGNLGWISAFALIFPLEEAAYRTAPGDVSLPVRTSYGYHLVRVNETRRSPGEILLSHIMVRAGMDLDEVEAKQAEEKIFMYYDMIRKGQDFGETARLYSEDTESSGNSGRMRWIRSGELPPDIEEQVYKLRDSASFTQPLRSIYGWHIFQLLGKRPPGSFEDMKVRLKEQVLADEMRKAIAERSAVSKMKEQSGFKLYAQNIGSLLEVFDSAIYTGQWDPAVAGNLIEPVFEIGGKEFLQEDLAVFIAGSQYDPGNESLSEILDRKSGELIRDKLFEYKNSRLEEDHPEFRDLVREYHDGILLFNISNDLIWQRAAQDSAGLMKFYEENKSSYMWEERADVSIYTTDDASYLNRIRKYAKRRFSRNWSADELLKRICAEDSSDCVVIEDATFERGMDPAIDQMKWRKGAVREILQDHDIQIIVINNVLPPKPKTFQEIRGMIVAAYQDDLEMKWVAELRKKYPVVVNAEAIKKMQ
ncbi:MAG: peptidylprolyl isomerase [Bacteroidales bacterium]|nr:peptidylprolyl isomerase [Bacteroidales bacterium]